MFGIFAEIKQQRLQQLRLARSKVSNNADVQLSKFGVTRMKTELSGVKSILRLSDSELDALCADHGRLWLFRLIPVGATDNNFVHPARHIANSRWPIRGRAVDVHG